MYLGMHFFFAIHLLAIIIEKQSYEFLYMRDVSSDLVDWIVLLGLREVKVEHKIRTHVLLPNNSLRERTPTRFGFNIDFANL